MIGDLTRPLDLLQRLRFSGMIGRAKTRYIFVVTYGRSGSTLLMNLLNAADGCMVRGENNNALYHLYRGWKALREARDEHGPRSKRQTSPWWGISDINLKAFEKELAKNFVEHILRPSPGKYILGFKEIRFSDEDVPDLEDYMDFLARVFYPAIFVVNHRRIDDVARSKWWRDDPASLQRLEEIDKRLWSLRGNGQVVHFEYDRAIGEHSYAEQFLGNLGLKCSRERVAAVFSKRHSY